LDWICIKWWWCGRNRPVIPVEYQSDALYVKPSPEVLVNLKVEKTDWSELWANLKKYVSKKRVESTAFDGEEGKAWAGGFF
jgi:hypothetical protein